MAVKTLEHDLREIFGSRVQSLVLYGIHAPGAGHRSSGHGHGHEEPAPVHTLTVLDSVGHDDLRACTARLGSWHDAGLATPLVLAAEEFARSLDPQHFCKANPGLPGCSKELSAAAPSAGAGAAACGN